MKNSSDTHLECISDFCGNHRHPGAWADIWQRQDGSKYATLGGDWEFYAPNAPETIEETDPRWEGFLKACEEGTDFGYVAANWP